MSLNEVGTHFYSVLWCVAVKLAVNQVIKTIGKLKYRSALINALSFLAAWLCRGFTDHYGSGFISFLWFFPEETKTFRHQLQFVLTLF